MLAATSAIVTGFSKERMEPSGSLISGMTGLKAKKKCGASRTFLVERRLTRLGFLNGEASSENDHFSSVRNFGRRYWNRTNDLHDVNVAL